jgi:hypothetical protein
MSGVGLIQTDRMPACVPTNFARSGRYLSAAQAEFCASTINYLIFFSFPITPC